MKQKTTAIVLAAGQGKRMGLGTAKQFLELDGRPVLYYSLRAFEQSAVDQIILVAAEDKLEYCRKEIVEKYGLTKVAAYVAGGKERYHSVYHGLKGIRESAGGTLCTPDIVLIHDGARPFVTSEMIEELIRETEKYGACVSATPVKDTIKIADEEGFCVQTPKRSLVWAVQTPQVFRYELAMRAYDELIQQEEKLLADGVQITDDAMVVETMLGRRVKLVEGDYRNMKLTTAEDLLVANAFFTEISKI